MRITFIDERHERAVLVKGWFRRRWAEVHGGHGSFWRYELTGDRVSVWMDRRLDWAQSRADREVVWQPTRPRLALAKVVSR